MRRRIIAFASALVVALGLGLLAATPAQAFTWGCPDGTACVYTGFNGTGSSLTISVGQYGVDVCHNFSVQMNNDDSSVAESFGSDLDMLIYANANCDSDWNDIVFTGECINTHGINCTGTDSGAWNFNTISLTRYNNIGSSFKIRSWA
jgi:peptidase inhibitor family I36